MSLTGIQLDFEEDASSTATDSSTEEKDLSKDVD
jgi:hypothetical protein